MHVLTVLHCCSLLSFFTSCDRRLSWEAATERFLDAASIGVREWPGRASYAQESMLWALYNTVTGAGPRIACFRGTPIALNRFSPYPRTASSQQPCSYALMHILYTLKLQSGALAGCNCERSSNEHAKVCEFQVCTVLLCVQSSR